MSESSKHRRPWTPQEDDALIFLRDELKVAKWPEVAKKMVENFKLEGRTEKQCRDRYVNFLKNGVDSYIWKVEDENKLMELYYQLGNRWSEIATYFPNTNGIFIKNKFYSRLRKAVRYLNTVIESEFYETEKKFSFDIIFKLVNISSKKGKIGASEEFKEILKANPKIFEDIINKLISLTNCSILNHLKKQKIQRISSKDELKWKKLIHILRYIEEEVFEAEATEEKSKKFGFEIEGALESKNSKIMNLKSIFNFLNNPYELETQERLNSIENSIQASYIEIKNIEESLLKWRKSIIIICDSKRFGEPESIKMDFDDFHLLKKEETLSLYECLEPLKKKCIEENCGLTGFCEDKLLELPCEKYVIAQP